MFAFEKCFTSDGVEIEGLYKIYPKVFNYERGYFFESYRKNDI